MTIQDPTYALLWTERLIALAVFLQTIELLQIRQTLSENGVWRWSILRQEFSTFSRFFRSLFDALLTYPNVVVLLWIRLAAAALVFFAPHPLLFLVLFLASLLICLRFRGTFNGGSDYMTLVVLSALCVASLFGGDPAVEAGALCYIALQTCLSYFISGLVKVCRVSWLSGRALSGFLNSPNYLIPQAVRKLSSNKLLVAVAAWGIIAFEVSFPLALLSPQICLLFIALAFIFHLANIYVFGLNRFLFAWLAAYPALYFCSSFLLQGQ